MFNLSKLTPENISGIKKDTIAAFQVLNINSIADLIYYFPQKYQDYQLSSLSNTTSAQELTVRGQIIKEPTLKWFRGTKSRILADFKVANFLCQAIWFNQPYLKPRLTNQAVITISGRYDPALRTIVVRRSFFSDKETAEALNKLEPIYTLTGGLKNYTLKNHIKKALTLYQDQIKEVLPPELLQKYRLLPRKEAILWLHSPANHDQIDQARRRMIYEELFIYQLKLLLKKNKKQQKLTKRPYQLDPNKITHFLSSLPVTPTKAQYRVIKEIIADLSANKPMHRLLQGDVGCGKTLVITAALYANFLTKSQGAVMVPTEILAEQHAHTLEQLLAPYNANVILLTGQLSAQDKTKRQQAIATGSAHIIIGTHALIQERVTYHKLGLVVTDEQHRFGVKQRSCLLQKSSASHPDLLTITATPIPRTLALTLSGDLDVSTIDEMPPGRKPVNTYWTQTNRWPCVSKFIAKECDAGNQAYVICPLVTESEKLDLQNAASLYTELQHDWPQLNIGLLHGKMTPPEKEATMRLFLQNKINILVATTVIEVGIDAPGATVIVIYDADRFGLAQLHQLRGRVGRGTQNATCILVANPQTADGCARLKIMTTVNDGFEIAKQDLLLRGPGDVLGCKQSGLPSFKIARLDRDLHILTYAHGDARAILPNLEHYPELASELRLESSTISNLT